ncbi:protein RFT1 [Elysia marginata]|uniref:Protein RFT1 homolog n=1 Tax=Elysia marginata TaxID=1093978 RepID=A0AAV4EXV5_9GAST|nr:protein RFT1 [Elysia marginata]
MQHSNIIKSAAKAASYNVLLQFGLRLTTFVLNGFILRYVSQETLGIVNVRLTLLYSTSLFLAKEAFERACLSKIDGRDMRQVINLLWCTFPLAIMCSSLLGFVWLFILGISSSPTTSAISYAVGVVSFGLSTVIEVLAEPLFVVGQACMFVKLKVVILGISQGTKCVLTVLLVLLVPEWGIINFSLAQLVSSIVYAALYHGYFIHYISNNSNNRNDNFPLKSIRSLYPSVIPKKILDSDDEIAFESIIEDDIDPDYEPPKGKRVKPSQAKGEKYVMTFFNVLSFGDQGIYDIINNLGSLAARFIFLPIEENSFLLFSQLLTRGKSVKEQDKESLRISARVLGVLLKFVTLIGAIIVVFGYSNSFLALHLYGGSMLSSGTVLVSLGLSFFITAASEHFLFSGQGLLNQLIRVLITGICLLSVLLMVYLFEHNMISLVKEQITRGRNKNQSEEKSKKSR